MALSYQFSVSRTIYLSEDSWNADDVEAHFDREVDKR